MTSGNFCNLYICCSSFRGRSVTAHAQWESMWFFGCVCDPRVIFTAAWGSNSQCFIIFSFKERCLSTVIIFLFYNTHNSLNTIPSARLTNRMMYQCVTLDKPEIIQYPTPTCTFVPLQDVDVYVGQRRTALLRIGAQTRVGRTLEQLLSHLEPRVKQVLQVMSFSHTDITAALSDRVRLSPGNKESIADSMRAFKSSPGPSLFQRSHRSWTV